MNLLYSPYSPGIRQLLACLDTKTLRALAATARKRRILPDTNKEAVEMILRYTESVDRLLSYRSLTSKVLFDYLHNRRVPVKVGDSKLELQERVKKEWEKSYGEIEASEVVRVYATPTPQPITRPTINTIMNVNLTLQIPPSTTTTHHQAANVRTSNMASSTSVPATTREKATGEPSMETPTKEYLNNFTKVQLQKHCRNIGLTNVWAKKDQLVDMIMAHHSNGATSPCNTSSSSERHSINSTCNEHESSVSQSSVSLNSEGDSVVDPRGEPISAASQCSERDSDDSEHNTTNNDSEPKELVVNHKRLESEIKKLYELFEIKNSEIKHAYEEIKEMNSCFHYLNDRLTRLEETVCGGRHSDSDPAAATQSNASLLTNISHRISDLEKKVNDTYTGRWYK